MSNPIDIISNFFKKRRENRLKNEKNKIRSWISSALLEPFFVHSNRPTLLIIFSPENMDLISEIVTDPNLSDRNRFTMFLNLLSNRRFLSIQDDGLYANFVRIFSKLTETLGEQNLLDSCEISNLKYTVLGKLWCVNPNNEIVDKLFKIYLKQQNIELDNPYLAFIFPNPAAPASAINLADRYKKMDFLLRINKFTIDQFEDGKVLPFDQFKDIIRNLSLRFGIEKYWNYDPSYLMYLHDLSEKDIAGEQFKFGIRWVSRDDWNTALSTVNNDELYKASKRSSFHLITIEADAEPEFLNRLRALKNRYGKPSFISMDYHGGEKNFTFSDSKVITLDKFKNESTRIVRLTRSVLKEHGQLVLAGCNQGVTGGFADVIKDGSYTVFALDEFVDGSTKFIFNENGIEGVRKIDYTPEHVRGGGPDKEFKEFRKFRR